MYLKQFKIQLVISKILFIYSNFIISFTITFAKDENKAKKLLICYAKILTMVAMNAFA